MHSQRDEAVGERRAILWGAVLFASVALIGHLVFARANILWLVLFVLAVVAVPQAFLRRSPGDARNGRRR